MTNIEPEEDFLRVSDFIKDEDIEPEEDVFKEDVFKEDVWLDYIPENSIYISKTAEGKEYANVVVGVWYSTKHTATLVVNPNQIFDAKRKDGSTVEGYKNILLGKEDEIREIPIYEISNNIADGLPSCIKMWMKNREIAEAVTEAHKAYEKYKAKA